MKQLPIRILGIVPYEAMGVALERAAEEFQNISIDVFTADMRECERLLQENPQSQFDCIISRGETAQILRKIAAIPVIETRLSVFDVKRTVDLAKNYSEKLAVVAYPAITETAHSLCRLEKKQIPIHTVHSQEDVRITLETLRAEGTEMFLGGAGTYRIAQEMGMNALLITSSTESLQESLRQAIEVGQCFRELRTQNLFLTTFMEGESKYLTVLDSFGNLHYSAPVVPQPELMGVFKNKIPEIPLHSSLRFYHTYYGKLFRIIAQRMQIGSAQYYVFHYNISSDPVRGGKAGMRIYTKSECEVIFKVSFFSMTGIWGELHNRLDTLARVQDAVMIVGEGGTGKSQIAHYLYLRGPNSNKSFVLIDCAAASDKTWENLLNRHDSPLLDNGNTICFQNFQAISPVNGRKLLELILSTKNHIRQRLLFSYDIREGEEFSEIYHQLMRSISCIPITPHPLRYRADEISPLANLYLGQLNMELGKQISGFEPAAMEQLCQFNWPGNFMQFKRILRELAIMEDSFYIRSTSVSEILSRERTAASTVRRQKKNQPHGQTLDEIIRAAILDALEANGGNQSAAAKQLGIGRSTLWRHLNSSETNK